VISKYKFGGKEYQEEFDVNLYDFGARNYDPALGRWMNVDPLAETTMQPYSAFNNNPILYNDPTGMIAEVADHIDVLKNDDGTYTVKDGEANSDKNVYVVDADGNRTGEILREMLTEYSFHNEDGSAVKGANIDLNDQSGQNFFNDKITNIGLFEYMGNAKGGEPLDFKTNDMPDGLTRSEQGRYTYRGMSFKGKIASARDVGNFSAGYVAGKHGFGWSSSRFAFDALETQQSAGTFNTVMLYPFNRVREGQPTQRAQQAGHNVGYPIFKQRQSERQWQRATNPWPIGPKY